MIYIYIFSLYIWGTDICRYIRYVNGPRHQPSVEAGAEQVHVDEIKSFEGACGMLEGSAWVLYLHMYPLV